MITSNTYFLNVASNDGFFGECHSLGKNGMQCKGVYVYQDLEDFASQNIDELKRLIKEGLDHGKSSFKITMILE
jgi:hypothetical protein